jgi:hypothetical protein
MVASRGQAHHQRKLWPHAAAEERAERAGVCEESTWQAVLALAR